MSEEEMVILVVSDDTIWRGTLGEMLDYRFNSPWIEMASSAEEALKAIKKEKNVSLIISDVWMQGMSGFELYSKTKAHRDIPFILMSGMPGMEKEAKKIGVKFFIPKPFWPKDLIKLVRKALK